MRNLAKTILAGLVLVAAGGEVRAQNVLTCQGKVGVAGFQRSGPAGSSSLTVLMVNRMPLPFLVDVGFGNYPADFALSQPATQTVALAPNQTLSMRIGAGGARMSDTGVAVLVDRFPGTVPYVRLSGCRPNS